MICRFLRSFSLLALLIAEAALAHPQSPSMAHRPGSPWWRYAVIYEIYPRSFQDSNGDGIGDIKGITQRLDYIQSLGVDAIWLTPIYPSPQIDFGYDISNYTAVDPMYGSMDDFDELLRQAKKRHIRVLMDLVLNHTSDQHPWFLESAKSRSNPKRDWYIWRDGRPAASGQNAPPNNWVNRIEQSAWRYDPLTNQFVYHYYAPEQPDLNWRNPEVKLAMLNVARFWLDRGVDGFRLDAINTLFEDKDLRDEPREAGTNEYGEPSLSLKYQRNLPEVHDVLRELRSVSDSYAGQRLLVGEVYTKDTKELSAWYGKAGDEIQLPMDTNVGFLNKLDAAAFRARLTEADNDLGNDNIPLLVFDNHDRPRSWDRYGDGKNDSAIAKILATILLAGRSSSLIYQGEELGMETITPTRKEDVRDPRGIAGWPVEKGRDGERTPMQWDTGTNAGFTTSSTPWLQVESSASQKNVATETQDPGSLLNWYRTLIHLKAVDPAVHSGRSQFLNLDALNVLGWTRESREGAGLLILCNMSLVSRTLSIAGILPGVQKSLQPIMASPGPPTGQLQPGNNLELPPFGIFIGRFPSATRGLPPPKP